MAVTDEELEELARVAQIVAQRAYAPYSHFFVGAALLFEVHGGERVVIAGCNVEVGSYRLTTCAEQAAIAAAMMLYGPELRVLAAVVYNRNGVACSPCGACRQTLAEFAGPDAVVIFPGADGPVRTSLGALLPMAFELSRA